MRELFSTPWLRLGERPPLRRRRLHSSDWGGEGPPDPPLGQSSPEDTGGSELSAVWRRKKKGKGGRASDCREYSAVEESGDAAGWLDGSFKCSKNGKRCLMAKPPPQTIPILFPRLAFSKGSPLAARWGSAFLTKGSAGGFCTPFACLHAFQPSCFAPHP
jgi:hypothetical protein